MSYDLENEINACESIEKLFALWKDEHRKDDSTLDKDSKIPREAFIPDGIIDENSFHSSKMRILFIAKESHQYQKEESRENNAESITKATFWLQNVANGCGDPARLSRRVAMLTHALCNQDYQTVVFDKSILRSVAYINLNKRGGYERCNNKVLKKYTIQYARFIAKEIELIDPEWIVCCGDPVERLLKKHVMLKSSYHIISIWHPSARKSYEVQLNRLRQAVQALNSVTFTSVDG